MTPNSPPIAMPVRTLAPFEPCAVDWQERGILVAYGNNCEQKLPGQPTVLDILPNVSLTRRNP